MAAKIITISREFGSGGRSIGKAAVKLLVKLSLATPALDHRYQYCEMA